jgi:hypothetical protein
VVSFPGQTLFSLSSHFCIIFPRSNNRLRWWPFWLYPVHSPTGAPSFAFFAKGGIFKSHPLTSHGSRPCSLGGLVFPPKWSEPQHPGLKSETWATHSSREVVV